MRLGSAALVAVLALLAGLAGPAGAAPAPADAPGRPPAAAAGHHLMMDTASAPSPSVMATWQAAESKSPYRAIGVYVPVAPGTDNRHDKVQTHLSPEWVRTVRSRGWQVLPIYVGQQAACQSDRFHRMSADAGTAWSQGVAAATYAADAVYDLGIPASAPVAFDLEAYPTGNARCTAAAQSFAAGWTSRLHQLGRLSAFYGSRSSTITDITNAHAADPAYPEPDVIWVATDSGQANTTFSVPQDGLWPGRRINQFTLGVTRTYGGVSINIDENAVQDTVWSLPPADSAAPRFVAPAPPSATKRKRVRISWRAADAAGVAFYQVRVRHAAPGRALGRWKQPRELRRTRTLGRTFPLRPGEQWCVSVRAVDRAGNRSAWELRCTARFADDRSLRAGPAAARMGGGYLGTRTVVRRPGVTLRGSRVAGSRVTVLMRGRGTLAVLIGGRRVGTVDGHGAVRLDLPRAFRGRIVLRSLSRAKVVVDGYAVTP
ncbi:MAG TPA: glycoside hydrolase domain-containing protein [Nocardioides sp.]|uniref:glycoside hydrolase domain-containing protein n=1 Tax=Nocardioides sp. TaxID=35761 RepID=UPI002ED8D9E7